jgi:serine/threonine-protein kinase HSL1 (negative regulator of Swe1 kinase)
VLYTKLLKFREEHLENYEGPTMEYSVSDYHHVNEPIRRSSTRQSHQPPLPTKRVSQDSILSGNAPRKIQSHRHQRQPSVPETEQSYDPFRASSRQQTARAEADRARALVVRGSSAASRQRPASAYSSRLTSKASVKNPALARIQDDAVYSLPPSSSSSGSPQQRKMSRVVSRRSMVSSSSAVRKSISYRRNVSFVHSQRRTVSSAHPTIKARRETNALTLQERYNHGDDNEEIKQVSIVATPRQSIAEASYAADSPKPEVPQAVRSRKTLLRTATVPDVVLSRASQFWRDETRKVSNELEKFCDEAFNRSSLHMSTTPATEVEDQIYSTPATSLSREVSGASVVQHPQRAKASGQLDPKALRERPLPRIPSPEHPGTYDFNQRELAKARELLLQRAADPSMSGSLDEVIAHLDRLMQPSAVRLKEQGRRAASTPDPKSPLERTNDTFERFLEKGYTGIRSASEPGPGDGAGADRSRMTVRMVDADAQKPISPTKPLTIRKKSGSSTPSTDSGRLRPRASQEQISCYEDVRPYGGTQGVEYRSAGLNLLDHPLEPIEEDEDKENFDPGDRKRKTLSGESKKRGWFRRHQQGQGSQESEQSHGQAHREGELQQDCQALQANEETTRPRNNNALAEARNGQKLSGKGRFLKLFGKRDGKRAKDVSKGASGGVC